MNGTALLAALTQTDQHTREWPDSPGVVVPNTRRAGCMTPGPMPRSGRTRGLPRPTRGSDKPLGSLCASSVPDHAGRLSDAAALGEYPSTDLLTLESRPGAIKVVYLNLKPILDTSGVPSALAAPVVLRRRATRRPAIVSSWVSSSDGERAGSGASWDW